MNTTNISTLDFSREQPIPFLVLISVQFTLGIPGNILVVVAVVKHKKLWLPGNIILASLAIADTITLLAFVVRIAEYTLKVYHIFEIWIPMCYLSNYLGLFGGGANIANLCLSSCDRFVAVRFPFAYRNKMKLQKMLYIVFFL